MESLEISGAECVNALVLSGFHIARRVPGSTFLERDGHVTIVPDALVLSPGTLEAILCNAKLSSERFIDILEDEPTLPDAGILLAG